MLPRSTRILLWLGVVIVASLLALNAYIDLKPAPKARITAPLTSLLPPAPAGWTQEDTPLADTPEQAANVENVLHFDDAVYRVYNNGEASIGVYVAHWLPGTVSPEKVGSHSPDTCWVRNGWDRLKSDKGVVQKVAGGTLKPMTTGEFSKDDENIYVIFWHLVGGEPVSYNLVNWEGGLAGRIQRAPAVVADFSRFGLDQRQEQLVVRISSTVPFSRLWDDAGFSTLMEGLGRAFDLYSVLPPGNSAPSQKQASVPAGQNEVRAM